MDILLFRSDFALAGGRCYVTPYKNFHKLASMHQNLLEKTLSTSKIHIKSVHNHLSGFRLDFSFFFLVLFLSVFHLSLSHIFPCTYTAVIIFSKMKIPVIIHNMLICSETYYNILLQKHPN